MNFLFTITAHGFEKAGKLESSLKELSIPFEVQTLRPVNGKKTNSKKMHITKIEIAAIISRTSSNPTWNNDAVAKSIGCSRATVERVMSNRHVLQIQGSAPKVQL